jgi:hypothetical protein
MANISADYDLSSYSSLELSTKGDIGGCLFLLSLDPGIRDAELQGN